MAGSFKTTTAIDSSAGLTIQLRSSGDSEKSDCGVVHGLTRACSTDPRTAPGSKISIPELHGIHLDRSVRCAKVVLAFSSRTSCLTSDRVAPFVAGAFPRIGGFLQGPRKQSFADRLIAWALCRHRNRTVSRVVSAAGLTRA